MHATRQNGVFGGQANQPRETLNDFVIPGIPGQPCGDTDGVFNRFPKREHDVDQNRRDVPGGVDHLFVIDILDEFPEVEDTASTPKSGVRRVPLSC